MKVKSFYILLASLLIFAWRISPAQAEVRRPLRFYGDSAYPPFSFTERTISYERDLPIRTERSSGFMVDLARILSGVIGRDMHVRLTSMPEVLSLLDSDEIDGLIGAVPQKDLEEKFAFSRPVLELEYFIFVLKHNDFVVSLDSLEGTMVAMYEGSAALDKVALHRNIDIHRTSSVLEALRRLQKREVTAVIAERSVATFHIRHNDLTNIKIATNTPLLRQPYSIAVTHKKGYLVKSIDHALSHLEDNHTIERLERKWFGEPLPRTFPWRTVFLVTAGLTFGISVLAGTLWVTSLNTTVRAKTQHIQLLGKKVMEKDKLAVLGKLAGQIAHELRTPLSIIHNSVYLLKREGSKDPDLFQKRLNLLEEKVKLSSNILESILSYSRVKASVPTTVSVKKCVESVISDVDIPAGIVKVIDIQGDKELDIYIDFHQLYSIIRNLVMNAIQAMGDKGKLTITAYPSHNARVVNIRVCDTGGGVPEPLREKIFDLFYSTKVTGTGLGLPISRSIVETHKGELYLASSNNIGACFMIKLPRPEIHEKERHG